MNTGYLTVFVCYLLIVLAVGVWGFKRESYGAYAIAERRLGLPLSVGSFFATYISSATVIGFVGYTTLHGGAIFPTYFWGFALGWITLTLIGARMRRLELRSVPALFEARYGGKALRGLSAVVIVVAFVFSVMTQLVAGSLVLHLVVGLPQVTGLLILGAVLTTYTVLGGLVSVVRTDFLQGGLILLAVTAAMVIVVGRLGGDVIDIDPERADIFGGSIASGSDILAFVLIAWGGVAAQPYYLHRFFAVRNTYTARQMIGIGAVFATIAYVAVLVIGLGLPSLVPEDQHGDSALLFFGTREGGILGSLLLIGIICAVQSTVDSALHLAGVYTTEDIVGSAKPQMSDRTRLALARTVTTGLGVICLSGAVYFVVSGGEFIVTLLNIWLGTLSSALLIPMYASLLWRRTTKHGAFASSAGGFFGYFITLSLVEFGDVAIPGHPIFYGFGTSLVLLITVTLATTPDITPEAQQRFFGTMSDEAEPDETTARTAP